jgi:hypothetical protein
MKLISDSHTSNKVCQSVEALLREQWFNECSDVYFDTSEQEIKEIILSTKTTTQEK